METKKKLQLAASDVMPCMLMVLMEFCTIGLTILASTVMSKGLSPFVFVVYTNALASIFLLPYNTFIISSRNKKDELIPPLLLLGFFGVTMAQNLAFVGLTYSSPIVAIGMSCLIPSISFILALLCRKTKIDLRSSSSRTKLVGTLISIMGGVTLMVYRGPVVKEPSIHLQSLPRFFVFLSRNENWILGCGLFAAASLSYSIWNIIQVKTLEKCPDVMTMASSYSLFGTFQTAMLAMIVERDHPLAWKLQFDLRLLVIILTAIFGSLIKSHVHMWCIQRKSQFYVTMFKPLGVPIAGMFGCVFFAETFHYGSLMAAAISGIGYYTMMWGQIRDDESRRAKLDHLVDERTPLLQHEEQV